MVVFNCLYAHPSCGQIRTSTGGHHHTVFSRPRSHVLARVVGRACSNVPSSRYTVYETLSCLSPLSLFPPQIDPTEQLHTYQQQPHVCPEHPIFKFCRIAAACGLRLRNPPPYLTMAPNTEVRATPYGIPYVVEFANVSIWPRPPLFLADNGSQPSDLGPKPPLSRSNTLPTTTTYKPLPSIPLPIRSGSLKIFRRKTIATLAKKDPPGEELDSPRPVIRRDASFTADARNSAHRHFKIFNDDFSASEETLVEFECTVAPTPPVPVVPSEDGLSLRTGGLYIQFPTPSTSSDIPSEATLPPSVEPATEGMSQVDFEKASRLRLHRLSRAISKAVLAAGMEAPPKQTKKFDAEEGASSKTGDARPVKGRQGLFKGTYGQVRDAFRAAGLVTAPCGEDGLPNGMLAPLCLLSVTCHTADRCSSIQPRVLVRCLLRTQTAREPSYSPRLSCGGDRRPGEHSLHFAFLIDIFHSLFVRLCWGLTRANWSKRGRWTAEKNEMGNLSWRCAPRLRYGLSSGWPAITQFACLIVLSTILLSLIRLRCFLPVQGIRLQWKSEELFCPIHVHVWPSYDRLFNCAIFTHA